FSRNDSISAENGLNSPSENESPRRLQSVPGTCLSGTRNSSTTSGKPASIWDEYRRIPNSSFRIACELSLDHTKRRSIWCLSRTAAIYLGGLKRLEKEIYLSISHWGCSVSGRLTAICQAACIMT